MTTTQLITGINSLPLDKQKEVEDFVAFLLAKAKNRDKGRSPIRKRQFGCAKGFFTISDDFDEPLDDFKEYME